MESGAKEAHVEALRRDVGSSASYYGLGVELSALGTDRRAFPMLRKVETRCFSHW